ncbi:hypothetical protein GQ53DRAFT_803000 [Thozetella sp. PMI_491]|nr:hypothetical protein GQ53DRAFT_803000 [Thozetella sp. PMI_491]
MLKSKAQTTSTEGWGIEASEPDWYFAAALIRDYFFRSFNKKEIIDKINLVEKKARICLRREANALSEATGYRSEWYSAYAELDLLHIFDLENGDSARSPYRPSKVRDWTGVDPDNFDYETTLSMHKRKPKLSKLLDQVKPINLLAFVKCETRVLQFRMTKEEKIFWMESRTKIGHGNPPNPDPDTAYDEDCSDSGSDEDNQPSTSYNKNSNRNSVRPVNENQSNLAGENDHNSAANRSESTVLHKPKDDAATLVRTNPSPNKLEDQNIKSSGFNKATTAGRSKWELSDIKFEISQLKQLSKSDEKEFRTKFNDDDRYDNSFKGLSDQALGVKVFRNIRETFRMYVYSLMMEDTHSAALSRAKQALLDDLNERIRLKHVESTDVALLRSLPPFDTGDITIEWVKEMYYGSKRWKDSNRANTQPPFSYVKWAYWARPRDQTFVWSDIDQAVVNNLQAEVEKQAKAFDRQRALSTQLTKELNDAKNNLAALKTELAAVKNDLATSERAQAASERALAALERALAERNDERDTLKSKLNESKLDLRKAQQDSVRFEAKVATLKNQIVQDAKVSDQQTAGLRKENIELKRDITSLKQELSRIDRDQETPDQATAAPEQYKSRDKGRKGRPLIEEVDHDAGEQPTMRAEQDTASTDQNKTKRKGRKDRFLVEEAYHDAGEQPTMRAEKDTASTDQNKPQRKGRMDLPLLEDVDYDTGEPPSKRHKANDSA